MRVAFSAVVLNKYRKSSILNVTLVKFNFMFMVADSYYIIVRKKKLQNSGCLCLSVIRPIVFALLAMLHSWVTACGPNEGI